MSILILLRHGQSEWNKLNLFTGWVDIPLSSQGIQEALKAGELIKNIPIDIIYSSTLSRALMTAQLAMSNHSTGKVPVVLHTGEGRLEWTLIHSPETKDKCIPLITAWQLNERTYGDLQGFNKKELAKKYGDEQVKIWRRSYDIPPPNGESLKMTAERTLPYFDQTIVPHLKEGKNVFVSAHGNSLRSIIMQLDGLDQQQVLNLELATGVPVVYEYLDGKFYKSDITQ